MRLLFEGWASSTQYGFLGIYSISLSLLSYLEIYFRTLKTHPNAGCFWQVTKWVPIPKESMAWPWEQKIITNKFNKRMSFLTDQIRGFSFPANRFRWSCASEKKKSLRMRRDALTSIFFHLCYFFHPRDGLRRKGAIARGLIEKSLIIINMT